MLRHRSCPFLSVDPRWRTVQARNAFGSARNRSRKSRYLRPELPNAVTHRSQSAPKLGERGPWIAPSHIVPVTWIDRCDCAQVREPEDLKLADAWFYSARSRHRCRHRCCCPICLPVRERARCPRICAVCVRSFIAVSSGYGLFVFCWRTHGRRKGHPPRSSVSWLSSVWHLRHGDV